MTTIVTLGLDAQAQAWFEAQRQQYFPPALNRIPAHVSLFHSLPGDNSVRAALAAAAEGTRSFEMRVDGVRSMGRGVMYTLATPELMSLHRGLVATFASYLTPQDKQPLRPHVVVQNKVEPGEAKLLLATLQAGFQRRTVEAESLLWWEYLGGPWRLIERFAFSEGASAGGHQL